MDGIELLAPAGDLEKLKAAITYGADAVYMGGKSLGLRAKAKNLDLSEMQRGISFAHRNGARVYVTANIFAHEDDFFGIEGYFRELYDMGVDALIISDPGIFSVAREIVPKMELHISTQANNTNSRSALFWKEQGAARVVLARELSFSEIKRITKKVSETDPAFVLESFVHGAMCISYSGRCLLSNYMAGRDSNRGECAQPCRWKYYLTEEKRPGEYFPIAEDERGAYIFNSKDLCMIGHIPALIEAGVKSFKIEGRMKSAYYTGAVTKAYRQAIDDYLKDESLYASRIEYYINELEKTSHREFTTGFYFEKPGQNEQIYNSSSYVRDYDVVAVVGELDEKTGLYRAIQRNKFSVGDTVEVLVPKGENFTQTITELRDESGESIDSAPHPAQKILIGIDKKAPELSMLRKQAVI